MKKVISFQAGFQKVNLMDANGTLVAVIGDVDALIGNNVVFNVDKLTRRGLTVYGTFLGTFQEFHISAKHFNFREVAELIAVYQDTDEE